MKSIKSNESLTRALFFRLMSGDAEIGGVCAPLAVVWAVGEAHRLLDHFPDHEVDDVLYQELRRRIDCNGDRLIQVGAVLGVNLIYRKDDEFHPEYRAWYDKLAFMV